ncbi:MAG TPA: succinylglutamate desuccinylase/aspartoacylase family protein, partial [Methanobacterium sp.]|nr:succinylglutamate desuccinylase/aspartoacylase family protein [Methanobacterium sp.]
MKLKFIILSIFILAGIMIILGSIPIHDNSSSESVQILDSNVHGNVMENPAIKRYLNNTSFNQEMVSKLEQGSLVYRLGNGKGKTIMIIGGIHGDEPQGPLTVTEFMNYLKNKEINGTIYIVPFAIPVDTEKNSRNYVGSSQHYDPNRKADVAGTPVNNILNFALAHKVDYIIDVHAGEGVSSNGLVYFQSNPEEIWAKYIQEKTGCVIKTKPHSGTFRSEA